MGSSRSDGWEDDYVYYAPGQVESVLDKCGLEVVSDTNTVFLTYCPFHGNSDTPAMAVNQTNGKWICFNPSCDQYGDLVDLPRRVLKMNVFQSMRLVLQCETEQVIPFAERIRQSLEEQPEFAPWPQEVLDKAKAAFPGSPGEAYMHGRGFTDDTLDYFDIGYSIKKNMVMVPMHSPTGIPIGVIGRDIETKRFENSRGLPKSKVPWNFHRAKREGDTVIITEASYDSMGTHQAGYPCTVGLLGGSLSDYHTTLIGRTFSRIIIATDFEQQKQYKPNCKLCRKLNWKPNEVWCQGHRPGRELGRQIVNAFPHKEVMWAAYDDTTVYPHGAKDMTDMTDAEKRQVIRNAVSNYSYLNWNPEGLRLE